jgi:hypothetical protein
MRNVIAPSPLRIHRHGKGRPGQSVIPLRWHRDSTQRVSARQRAPLAFLSRISRMYRRDFGSLSRVLPRRLLAPRVSSVHCIVPSAVGGVADAVRGLLPLPTPCRRFDFQVASAPPPGFARYHSPPEGSILLASRSRGASEPDSIDCAAHRRRARRLRRWKRLKGNELGHNRQRNRRWIRRRCRWSGLFYAAWVERHRTSRLSLIHRRSQRRARYTSHWISKITDICLRRLLPCL